MADEALEMLIVRYLDGAELTPDEQRQLAQALADDPQARRLLLAQARLDAAFVVARRPRSTGRGRRLLLLAGSAGALAASVALLVALLHGPGTNLPPAAAPAGCGRIVIADPGTSIERGGQRLPAAAQDLLRPGDRLHARGTVLIAQGDDGTRCTLTGGAQEALLREAAPGEVRLEHGVLTVAAAHQAPGRHLIFATPDAITEVVGTAFRLQVDRTGTGLEVTEGRVRFSGTTGPTCEVGAGAAASAPTGGRARLVPPAPRPIEAPFPDPLLPPPYGRVVRVQSAAALAAACATLTDHTTVWIAPGDYRLAQPLLLKGLHDVELRGSGAASTILHGPQGEGFAGSGLLLFGCQDVRVCALSLGDCAHTGIELGGDGGVHTVLLRGLRLFDCVHNAVQSSASPPTCDDVHIADCSFCYTRPLAIQAQAFINDIGGQDWRIERCQFARLPYAGHVDSPPSAIFITGGATGARILANTFLDCTRAVQIGGDPPAHGDAASDAVVAENIVWNRPRPDLPRMDTPIGVWDAPRVAVLQNTILLGGTFPFAIDLRYAGTRDGQVAGNLTDGGVPVRDGASAAMTDNRSDAQPGWFEDPAHGDFRLRPDAPARASMPAQGGVDWRGVARPAGGRDDLGAETSTPASR